MPRTHARQRSSRPAAAKNITAARPARGKDVAMQITQTVSEDLHRQFTVTVPAGELDSRVTSRLEEMKPKISLKGFRPGKAPISFLKKQFGKSLMGEIVEQAVNEGSQKAISDNQLKPAQIGR